MARREGWSSVPGGTAGPRWPRTQRHSHPCLSHGVFDQQENAGHRIERPRIACTLRPLAMLPDSVACTQAVALGRCEDPRKNVNGEGLASASRKPNADLAHPRLFSTRPPPLSFSHLAIILKWLFHLGWPAPPRHATAHMSAAVHLRVSLLSCPVSSLLPPPSLSCHRCIRAVQRQRWSCSLCALPCPCSAHCVVVLCCVERARGCCGCAALRCASPLLCCCGVCSAL